MDRSLYYEHVTERAANGIPLASTVTPATPEQIAHAAQLHALGKCPHTIVYDEAGWLYDLRTCHTCGKGLGTI